MSSLQIDDQTLAGLASRASVMGLDVAGLLRAVAGLGPSPLQLPIGEDFVAELHAFLATQPPGPALSAASLTREDFYES